MFFVDILIAIFLFNFIFVHDIALSRSQTISMERLFENLKVTFEDFVLQSLVSIDCLVLSSAI